MADRTDISELHRLLNYDQITGHVTWKVRKRNEDGVDKYDAKCPTCNKYWHVKAPKEQ